MNKGISRSVITLAVLGLIVFGIAFYVTYKGERRDQSDTPRSISSGEGISAGGFTREYEADSRCDGVIYYDVDTARQAGEAACTLVLRDIDAMYAEVWQMKQLGELAIRSDKIVILPEQISQLANLEVLDVAGSSRLKVFQPDLFTMKKLRLLNISGTSISAMPQGIENLKQLERFFVHDGQFPDEELNVLRAKLPDTQITELDPVVAARQ